MRSTPHIIFTITFTMRRLTGNRLPSGYGVGISVGSAIKVQPETIISELNEIDFVGYTLNCGARMQTLAGAYGVALCSTVVATIDKAHQAFLYPNEPAFARELVAPTAAALKKAASLRGLLPKDQSNFRYLTWLDLAGPQLEMGIKRVSLDVRTGGVTGSATHPMTAS